MNQNKMSMTHRLVLMALLVALNVVLSRMLSLSLWNFKIGFSFVPIVLAAMLLGPMPAAIVCAVADFVGALLFPIGEFFPGFTATAFLSGLIYGLFLYKKQDMKRIFGAVLSTELLCSLLLNSFWISLMYGAPFWSLLPARLLQGGIMMVVEILVIRVLVGYVPHLVKMQRA